MHLSLRTRCGRARRWERREGDGGGRRRLRRLDDFFHAAPPLPSLHTQASGLKSKRFTKTMLAQMRRSGEVRTVPAVSGKSFGYAAATPKPGREGAA